MFSYWWFQKLVNFLSHTYKCLKIHQLNTTKKRKATGKCLWEISRSFQRRKRNKMRIWLQTVYKSLPKDEEQRFVEYRKVEKVEKHFTIIESYNFFYLYCMLHKHILSLVKYIFMLLKIVDIWFTLLWAIANIFLFFSLKKI